VPGPQIQGEGYDEPLTLTLSERIADAGDLPVALRVMADRVACVLARIIVDKGVSVKAEPGQTPQKALYEAICWYLGVDGTYGWQEALPSADSPRPRAERWVEKVAARKRVWPSQQAAIRALVLQNASPAGARRAAQAAYAAKA
jgi:hypothetical protein